MSKRAEEAALKAYPNEHFVDNTYAEMCRGFYEEGYEQAEKDVKDALLEWANKKLQESADRLDFHANQAYAEVIDKLNSL